MNPRRFFSRIPKFTSASFRGSYELRAYIDEMEVTVHILELEFGSSIFVVFVKNNGFSDDIGYSLLVLGG